MPFISAFTSCWHPLSPMPFPAAYRHAYPGIVPEDSSSLFLTDICTLWSCSSWSLYKSQLTQVHFEHHHLLNHVLWFLMKTSFLSLWSQSSSFLIFFSFMLKAVFFPYNINFNLLDALNLDSQLFEKVDKFGFFNFKNSFLDCKFS